MWAGRMAQAVVCLPSKYQDLTSNSHPTTKKEKKNVACMHIVH
jgi:hypothetical protein